MGRGYLDPSSPIPHTLHPRLLLYHPPERAFFATIRIIIVTIRIMIVTIRVLFATHRVLFVTYRVLFATRRGLVVALRMPAVTVSATRQFPFKGTAPTQKPAGPRVIVPEALRYSQRVL
jgi:hypothetical protein